MHEGTLHLTEERALKLMKSLDKLITQLRDGDRVVAVKVLAVVVGQLISAQPVFGLMVRLRTRQTYECIQERLSWYSKVYVTEESEKELKYWLQNHESLNAKGFQFSHLTESDIVEMQLVCDASGEGYGGYLATEESPISEGTKVKGNWNKMRKVRALLGVS